MNNFQKLIGILRSIIRSSRSIHDVSSLVQLRPLLKNYIPFSSMAMSPAEIAKICNDVCINNRKKIVEFGSGASTVFIAKIMPKDSLLYSVDHDEKWLAIVSGWLENEGLRDRVVMIHAPLEQMQVGTHHGKWYKRSVLEASLPADSIDCLIVDGPPAGASGHEAMVRYPAVPVLKSSLAPNCTIYLDDAVRKGEKRIAEIWGQELGITFRLRLDTGGYAVAQRGEGYMD
jgi:hypothetical protein